jgi:hypothetical protein
MVRSILTANRTRSTWAYRQQQLAEQPSPAAAAPAEATPAESCPIAPRSRRSREKKTGTKGYTIADDKIKASINLWLAAAVQDYAAHAGSSGWALLLETRTLLSVQTLEAAAAFVAERIIVPNPDPEECNAMMQSRPGLHALPLTSHDLLTALSDASSPLTDQLSLGGFDGAFQFVWLDYCGTMSSGAGRARQKDLVNLFAGESSLVRHGTLLAVTFSCRGSSALYSHELVDSLILLVQCLASDKEMTAVLHGVVSYSISTPMYTISFVISDKIRPIDLPGRDPLSDSLSPSLTV